MLMVDTNKCRKLVYKVGKESSKKGQAINCKETECMAMNKRVSTRCKLQIEDITIEHIQKFNCLKSVVTDDGKYNKEIQRMHWKNKYDFKN